MFFNFYQPLDQFDIFTVNNAFLLELIYNQVFTSTIFLICINFFAFNNQIIYVLFLFLFYFILTYPLFFKKLFLIPITFLQYIYEIIFYKFLLNVLVSQVGKRGEPYFIYCANLFFFILLSNILGLIPSSFTITSHIILTFMLGFSSIVGLTILGFLKQKLHFLNLFVPTGVPSALLPLLVFIEVVSYVSRGFSLSIRLFANLMSGHSLLHILLFFTTKLIKVHYVIGLLSLALISAIFLLEIGIAFLQAYVFMVLITIYLKDSFEVGH